MTMLQSKVKVRECSLTSAGPGWAKRQSVASAERQFNLKNQRLIKRYQALS